jgi:5-methylthioadenosine/S-adenosylhomocysteine deaminase
VSVLIKRVTLNGQKKDIYIRGNHIQKIDDVIAISADVQISGDAKAAIPSFINGHTHSGGTLMTCTSRIGLRRKYGWRRPT